MSRTSINQIVIELDRFFSNVYSLLEGWQGPLEAFLTEDQGVPPTVSEIDEFVRPLAFDALDSGDLPVYGAGFIPAKGSFDQVGALSWWQGTSKTQLTFTTSGDYKSDIDYYKMEWYRVPAKTHQRHVAGPYVDYLCSDDVTVTVALPLIVDDTFLGVSCVDVLVEAIEDHLLPRFTENPAEITVVNQFDRVLVSSNPSRATGEVMDSIRPEYAIEPGLEKFRHHPCGVAPFSVVTNV